MVLKINKILNWLGNRFNGFKILHPLRNHPLVKISRVGHHTGSTSFLKFNKIQAPWHLVDPSPWPLVVSMLLFSLTVFLVAFMHCYEVSYFFLELTILVLTYALLSWGRDVVVEGTFQGYHNSRVRRGFTYGIVLFILSEVMFFFSFFWAFFHSALIPSPFIGGLWPPIGVLPLNPVGIALLNTSLLLTSGLTITWAHWSILFKKREESIKSLLFTIILGVAFLFCQFYEYLTCPFSIADGVFGSCFFMITGLHGLHVFFGAILLIISFFRHLNYHFTRLVHVGFVLAAWYWHFVDAVWIFVFAFLYCWSSITVPNLTTDFFNTDPLLCEFFDVVGFVKGVIKEITMHAWSNADKFIPKQGIPRPHIPMPDQGHPIRVPMPGHGYFLRAPLFERPAPWAPNQVNPADLARDYERSVRDFMRRERIVDILVQVQVQDFRPFQQPQNPLAELLHGLVFDELYGYLGQAKPSGHDLISRVLDAAGLEDPATRPIYDRRTQVNNLWARLGNSRLEHDLRLHGGNHNPLLKCFDMLDSFQDNAARITKAINASPYYHARLNLSYYEYDFLNKYASDTHATMELLYVCPRNYFDYMFKQGTFRVKLIEASSAVLSLFSLVKISTVRNFFNRSSNFFLKKTYFNISHFNLSFKKKI